MARTRSRAWSTSSPAPIRTDSSRRAIIAGSTAPEGDWNGALSWGGELGPARLFVSGGYQHRGELTTLDRGFSMLSFPENPQGGWSGGGAPGNFDFNGTLAPTRFDADEGCEEVGGFRSLPGSTADLCQVQYLGFTNLVEPEDRFQLFADAEIGLSDTAELRVTGLYGRTETVLTTSPSYLPTIAPSSNAAFGGQGLFVIPSYAPALIDYCARFGADAGCVTDGGGNVTQSALAFPVRFRPLLAGGNPLFDNDRQTAVLPRSSDMYQFTGELDVALGASLDLVAGVTYSEYDRYFEGGDSFVDLLQNALAGFGGESCACATPQSRAGMTAAELAAVAGTDGCHYFNPFSSGIAANAITGQANPNYAGTSNPLGFSLAPGAGLINDASTVDDFFTVIQRKANTSQWVGDLTLSGMTGLELGGGEVSFAVGRSIVTTATRGLTAIPTTSTSTRAPARSSTPMRRAILRPGRSASSARTATSTSTRTSGRCSPSCRCRSPSGSRRSSRRATKTTAGRSDRPSTRRRGCASS